MSNNANKNTSAPSTTNTTPPPASSSAKPTVTPGDVKVSVGNGASAEPARPSAEPTPPGTTPEADAAKADTDPLLYFIVTGPVKSFKSPAKAEEYLNSPDAPAEYTVIRGRAAPAQKRVSLRG